MKKWIAILLSASMLAAMLAGCGGDTQRENGGGRELAAEQIYRTLYSSESSTLNYLYSTTEVDMSTGVNGTMTL